MLVTELKGVADEFLSSGTMALIPDNCFNCQEPMEINETITHLTCSNPYCSDKIALRTVAMFEMLKVMDLGESTVKKLVDLFEVTCPLQFFMFEDEDFDEVDPFGELAPLRRKATHMLEQLDSKRDMTLEEFFQLANLPNIQTSASKLLEGVESFEELYENLDTYGVEYIRTQLGIQSEVSIRAMGIYHTLQMFKEDLEGVLNSGFVNIYELELADVKINAVCTDQVGGSFSRKADLYEYVHFNYGDKVHVDWGKSATKSMDVLIWAGADGTPARYTSKVRKTEEWNAKGDSIPILTASQFIDILDRCSDGQTVLDTLESM